MSSALRVATVVLGIFFTFQGVGWLVDPASSAAALGMPLLDGLARSTQVGDFAIFFLAGGGAILLGSRRTWERVLYFPIALIGGAAITRTIAWAFHGADFAALFILVELTTAAVLLTVVSRTR
jgi:hypothetical protein